ncbi:P-type DNA transfer protein VirB5 [Polynucleobacter sp. 31A-FELB]|jgi:type IV secretion system protein VirB5|uniref:P-type DNA transfer protein VirB5 n=1 Tax=Polynucleobacter sp. 31A-FELB TaxID=2689096 RepID=UPI0021083D1E|nr:P-type DNA transfer protein VirB5 [Polynucleobacter sp. 31A-FELB]
MKFCTKKSIVRIIKPLLLASVLSMSAHSHAQGIPVFDAANYTNMIQTITAWQQQIAAMKQQYDQSVTQYQALTGIRGYGSLLSNPQLQQFLPADIRNVYTAINTKNPWITLNSAAQAARNAKTIFSCESVPAGIPRNTCMSSLNKNFADQDLFQQAYEQVQLHDKKIADLMAQINFTQDPKAIAELQARLTVEQSFQQNAMAKLSIATELAKTQTKLIEQEKNEYMQSAMSHTGTVKFQPPNFSLSK